MWTWLRTLLPCSHPHRYYARTLDDKFSLVCDACGHVAIPDLRDDEKLKKLQAQWKPKRTRKKKGPAEVWHLPARNGR